MLHMENETVSRFCFSLSMATVNYKVRGQGNNLTCKSERWSNYRDVSETCGHAEGTKDGSNMGAFLYAMRCSDNRIIGYLLSIEDEECHESGTHSYDRTITESGDNREGRLCCRVTVRLTVVEIHMSFIISLVTGLLLKALWRVTLNTNA